MDRVAENTQLYQVLEVAGDTLRYTAKTVTGEVYDRFDLIKQGTGKPNLLVEKKPATPERRHTFDLPTLGEATPEGASPPSPAELDRYAGSYAFQIAPDFQVVVRREGDQLLLWVYGQDQPTTLTWLSKHLFTMDYAGSPAQIRFLVNDSGVPTRLVMQGEGGGKTIAFRTGGVP
jgi:hypothetical protein